MLDQFEEAKRQAEEVDEVIDLDGGDDEEL